MTYSQRKFTMSKADRAALSKWANKQQARDDKNAVSERQRDIWDDLNAFVTERGGAITSVKYHNPVRLEVPPDSELPEKLREWGFDPVYLSEETKIGAPVSTREGWRLNANVSYSFVLRHVYEIRLPK